MGSARSDEGVSSLGQAPVEKEGTENGAEDLRDYIGNENGLGHPVGSNHCGANSCDELEEKRKCRDAQAR